MRPYAICGAAEVRAAEVSLLKDAQCASQEYDYDGQRKESLNGVEQMQNDIFGCDLDLPMSEDDGESGF